MTECPRIDLDGNNRINEREHTDQCGRYFCIAPYSRVDIKPVWMKPMASKNPQACVLDAPLGQVAKGMSRSAPTIIWIRTITRGGTALRGLVIAAAMA